MSDERVPTATGDDPPTAEPPEVEVRVGNVVDPEGPEDWRRPLTWLAAIGMLLAPAVALAWLSLAPPEQPRLTPGAWLLAALLPAGSALTASTQRGALRALAATLAAAIFGALLTLIIASSLGGQPTREGGASLVAHAVAALAAGGAGVVLAALLAAPAAGLRSRAGRAALPALAGAVLAFLLLPAAAGALLPRAGA